MRVFLAGASGAIGPRRLVCQSVALAYAPGPRLEVKDEDAPLFLDAHGDGGSMARDVRKRRFPIIGRGSGLFSFIHVDDAAGATVAAVERGAPGVYNVVDDVPAPMREWLPAYAGALGARRPLRIPLWLARLAAGPIVRDIDAQPGALNLKAKRELGWSPRWRSWRSGFREAPR